MSPRIAPVVIALCLCAGFLVQEGANAAAQPPSDGPPAARGPVTSQPARPATPPAAGEVSSSGDRVVDVILDRLEARGRGIRGLSCEVVYHHVTTVPFTEKTKKVGKLLFSRADNNSQFLIHFTRRVADGVVIDLKEIYAFDGQWFVELHGGEAKSVTRRQIARPGEKIDPFELGKGPFPLPFGQKRSEILKHFEVSLGRGDREAPPGSKHLHCVPRVGTPMAEEYKRVEIFVDPRRDIPVRVVTERVEDKSRVEVDFNAVNLNDAPAASRFKVETPPGYSETIEVIEEEPQIDLTPRGDMPGGSRP